MPKTSHIEPSLAIGQALKSWREERGFSLRTVASASEAYPEKISFDYLSRLERGHLMPSIPKLATLANVYRKPLMQLVDLYEVEELRKLVPKKAGYETLQKLGLESVQKGELLKALACYLGALDVARRDPDKQDRLAMAHSNVGGSMIQCGRYFTARQYLEEGLRIADEPRAKLRILDNLAIVHYALDNLELALIHSDRAVEISEENNLLPMVVRATRSAVLQGLKRFEEAEALMQEVVATHRKEGNQVEEIRWTFNIGDTQVKAGKVEAGLKNLREAAAAAAEIGNPNLRATSQIFLGRNLLLAGRPDDAVSPLKAAMRIAKEHQLRNQAFHAAYYLWRIAVDAGNKGEASDNLAIAKRYRLELQQRTEEAEKFDFELAAVKSTDRRGRRPSSGAHRPYARSGRSSSSTN